MAVRKFEHVGVRVSSLEDSIEFYQEVIGLKLLYILGGTDEELRLAFLVFPEHESVQLELIWVKNDPGLPSEGVVHHIAYTVTDIEAEYVRISELGLSGLDPVIRTLPNGNRLFFFNGPDGERIEFFEPASIQ